MQWEGVQKMKILVIFNPFGDKGREGGSLKKNLTDAIYG